MLLFCESDIVAAVSYQPALAASEAFSYGSALGETKPRVARTCRADLGLPPAASSHRQETAANLVTYNTLGFMAYLERQGRNEFINLASQKDYDGSNVAFGVGWKFS